MDVMFGFIMGGLSCSAICFAMCRQYYYSMDNRNSNDDKWDDVNLKKPCEFGGIDVDERLPEPYKRVFVLYGGDRLKAHVEPDGSWVIGNQRFLYWGPSHWEPYTKSTVLD